MNLTSIDIKQIRIFGIIAFIFFGSLCGLGVWSIKIVPTCIFGFLSVLGFGFIVLPGPLKPVYIAWLKVTNFIGRIITSLILMITYYIVITPTAFLKRIFGGVPLPTKANKTIASYWKNRELPLQPKEQFFKRF